MKTSLEITEEIIELVKDEWPFEYERIEYHFSMVNEFVFSKAIMYFGDNDSIDLFIPIELEDTFRQLKIAMYDEDKEQGAWLSTLLQFTEDTCLIKSINYNNKLPFEDLTEEDYIKDLRKFPRLIT